MEHALQTSSANRRKFIRIRPELTAPVRIDINGVGFIDAINAVDIGENGIGIQVHHGFRGCQVDQPASFVIHLPHPINKYLLVEGLIRHVKSNLFGVRFTNVNAKARIFLRQYISDNLRKKSMWDYLCYTVGLTR